MTAIPSNLSRVPTLLSSQIMLNAITQTNRSLLELNGQLASGREINRPSDDAVGASLVTTLDRLLEQRGQRLDNLQHAESSLNVVDAAIADANDMLLQARAIASSQIGVGSDATTRANESIVIDSMIREMVNIANRQYRDNYLFGGEETSQPPITDLLGGLRYNGRGEGLVTDLGFSPTITTTSSGAEVFGTLSGRIDGEIDLNPGAAADTRVSDLHGRHGLGVRRGPVDLIVNGTVHQLDFSSVDTLGDVVSQLEDYLNTNTPGVLGVGGVTIGTSGETIDIDVAPPHTVDFADPAGEGIAADLGLTGATPFQDGGKVSGFDFDPRLTELTQIGNLNGIAGALGTLRVTNGGQSRDVDLSAVSTVQDLQNTITALNLGVRVEINAAGDRLSFVNELSGGELSIAEVTGGDTATRLGVRSLSATTSLADFNHGRGVNIVSGSVDPVSGTPDPSRDLDFQITLKDNRSFSVDLSGAVTVQDVLDDINVAAFPAAIVPTDFEARLTDDGNGIELVDNTGPGTTTVTALNGSTAAADLGIMGSETGAVFTGEDRATIAVEGVFSHLMSLREALVANDETGITLAADKLESDLERLATARAEAGVRARRISDATIRQEDLTVQDQSLKSQVQDLDFTEAAIRFATLQQQLEAGLSTTARVNSLTLLDFLR